MNNVFDFPGKPELSSAEGSSQEGVDPELPGKRVAIPVLLDRFLMLLEGVKYQIELFTRTRPMVAKEAQLVLTGLLSAAIAALDLAGLPEWGERFQLTLDRVFTCPDKNVLGEVVALCAAIRKMDPAIAESSRA